METAVEESRLKSEDGSVSYAEPDFIADFIGLDETGRRSWPPLFSTLKSTEEDEVYDVIDDDDDDEDSGVPVRKRVETKQRWPHTMLACQQRLNAANTGCCCFGCCSCWCGCCNCWCRCCRCCSRGWRWCRDRRQLRSVLFVLAMLILVVLFSILLLFVVYVGVAERSTIRRFPKLVALAELRLFFQFACGEVTMFHSAGELVLSYLRGEENRCSGNITTHTLHRRNASTLQLLGPAVPVDLAGAKRSGDGDSFAAEMKTCRIICFLPAHTRRIIFACQSSDVRVLGQRLSVIKSEERTTSFTNIGMANNAKYGTWTLVSEGNVQVWYSGGADPKLKKWMLGSVEWDSNFTFVSSETYRFNIADDTKVIAVTLSERRFMLAAVLQHVDDEHYALCEADLPPHQLASKSNRTIIDLAACFNFGHLETPANMEPDCDFIQLLLSYWKEEDGWLIVSFRDCSGKNNASRTAHNQNYYSYTAMLVKRNGDRHLAPLNTQSAHFYGILMSHEKLDRPLEFGPAREHFLLHENKLYVLMNAVVEDDEIGARVLIASYEFHLIKDSR